MADHRHLLTANLELSVPDRDHDVEALFRIWSDPASWKHAPELRHLEPSTTADWLNRTVARWERDGLSYWTVRRRDTGEVIGSGGASRHITGSWNLLWRIDTSQRRRGFATEIGRAAIAAAVAVDDSVPVIAWIRSSNTASRRVAIRLGLIEHSERDDKGNGVIRIPYADRAI